MAKLKIPFRWDAVPRMSGIFCACIFAGLLCAVPAGCSRFGNQRKVREIARGRILFETHCGGCHNGKKLAAGVQPPSLNGVFQHPYLPSGADATNAQVRSTILTGRSGIMPSFQDTLTDHEISDIIEYLHTLKSPQPRSPENSGS
jgi:mono/diheme cytochrome c family protein